MAARLLVVEDERSIRVTLRQIFEQEGYQTDEATSVEEAIAKLAGSPYDVLLLDLSLDGDDGLKVLDHLREKSPDTSAIILTGDSSLENATQALRLGALDYLIKPCLVDDLKAAMTRALERRAVAMEAHQRSERAQTQLIALERATQVEAEAAQRRAWFLAEATAVLASSLDFETTLERVANLAILELADVCSVYLVEADDHLRQVAVAALDPAKARLLRILGTEYLPNPDESAGSLLRQALQTQRPQLVAEYTEDLLTTGVRDAEHLRLRRELGLHTRLAVPLLARDRVLGGMVLGCIQPGRQFGRPELQLVEELARRAAAAVDNARLYHAEQEARRAAERAVERMTRLQAVTATLAQPFDLPDVAARIVDEVRAALGAKAGAVIRLIEDGLVFEVIHEAGYRGDTAAARQVLHTWRRFPSGGNTPADDAVRTGEPIILGSSADRVVRYPHLTSIESLIGEGASVTLPLVIDGRSVGVMYLSFATPRVFDPDDRAFLVAIAHQCSIAVERARLYEAERRARADAEAALRLREEFLSIAAHELKTPVAAIRLIVQVALQRLDRSGELGPERVVQFLRDIDQQSDRLTRLVKQLLDVSRLETGRLRLERAPAELTALIDEVIVSLGPRDGTERIVVEGKEPVVANVDRLRVEQVIGNLLDNALKYGGDGPIVVRVSRDDRSAIVAIADQGAGIPPELRDRLFERFYQAHHENYVSGLGLGLYISRQVAEFHGGTLHAEFPPGGGSCFILTLPLDPDTSPGDREPAHRNLPLVEQGSGDD